MAGREDLRQDDGRYASKLTLERAAAIVASVKSGLFDQQIALENGVDVSTLKSWVERGLDEEGIEPYRSFAEDYIREAIALEQRLLTTVMEASEPYAATKETIEIEAVAAGFNETDWDDVESYDSPPGSKLVRRTTKSRESRRGDWKAAAWVLERRWPLRWSSSRQPDGGPKEAIRLPDGALNRRRRVEEQLTQPSPEMIKAFRDKGYAIVRISDAASAADETI
jgi:hypothetical protein